MTVLVDYDNVPKAITRLGISHVVSSIVSRIDPIEMGDGNRHITIRLYGGWYDNNRFTQRAQNLSADIANKFPSTSVLADGSASVFVRCEMAYSLLADPSNHLFHTFRQRGIPEGLKADHPAMCGCTQQQCPIIHTYNFITNQVCIQCRTIAPKDILYRGEQKLVDTMLTSDLIFSSRSGGGLCVVSSDDDLWPGIVTTLKSGATVVHLHTKAGAKTPTFYSRVAGNTYIERNL